MSEQDEQRPLTRRERRLREMAETGALDLSEVADVPAPADGETADAGSRGSDGVTPQTSGDEVEISPFNEDGSPRSRREMRRLREEALASREAAPQTHAAPVEETVPEAAAVAEPPGASEPSGVPEAVFESSDAREAPAGPEAEAAAEPEVAAEPEIVAEPEVAAVAGPEAVAEPATGEVDFDTLIAPPTEPFTVSELREAEQPPEDTSPEEYSNNAAQTDSATVSETVPDAAAASDEAETSPKSKRRFPWKRSKDAAQAAPEGPPTAVETAAVETAAVDSAEPAARETDGAAEGGSAATTAIPEVADAATTAIPAAQFSEDDAPSSPETDASLTASEAVPQEASEASTPGEKTSYSFPDIAPPEEWRSVFDDPASRNFPTPGNTRDDGDFDDLISRAVAQEGSTGGTGTAALILPSMPDDTGGLTGPLGGTGDLYLTGSLKLPRSLGETGGHSALHDSIEMDPITGEQTGDPQTTGQGPAPVSARHAVSALVPSGVPVVAKPTKERSKLPLVLSLTGGGLLIVVVGLGVWGASNGMFG